MHIDVFSQNGTDPESLRRDFGGWLAAHDRAPDFVALHQSVPSLGAGLADQLCGAGALHGATSCLGVMSQSGPFIRAGAGAFAIWDGDGDYGSAMRRLGGDPQAAARAATEAALVNADRPGEAPDLIWLSAAPGTEEAVLKGIESVVGANVPILGGSAADDTVEGQWSVFNAQGSEASGVVVSALFPSTRISFAYHNGYAPTRHEGTITAAQDRRLIEIDGRPAADVYRDWTGNSVIDGPVTTPRSILSESTLSPLGRYLESVSDVPYFLLAHPAGVNPDGSLDLFADVGVGETLTCMTGTVDSLVARAGKVAALAVTPFGNAPAPAGALIVYCGGCMLAVQDNLDKVADSVRTALPETPFLGIFTFGEQGMVLDRRNHHGNLMISAVVFGTQ